VRDQIGHSSIQVTVDIYGHLVPGSNKQAVDRLDEPVDNWGTRAESATIRNQDLEREAKPVGFGVKGC
jgi:integrase